MLSLGIDSLQPDTYTDFDLYLNIHGRLTLYAVSPYEWIKDELDRLESQGHRFFYYFKTDKKKVEAYLHFSGLKPLELKGTPRERVVSLTDAAAEFTRVLFDYPLSPEAVAKGNEIAKGMVMCMLEDPTCVTALGKLANHDHYTYYHSARVSAYALAIALLEKRGFKIEDYALFHPGGTLGKKLLKSRDFSSIIGMYIPEGVGNDKSERCGKASPQIYSQEVLAR